MNVALPTTLDIAPTRLVSAVPVMPPAAALVTGTIRGSPVGSHSPRS